MVAVGLDIGWQYVKAIEITSDLRVTKVGKFEINRIVKENNDKVCVSKIIELFNLQKLSKDNVIINLRGSYILARTYEPPSTNKDAFERWFVDSIESLIPGTPLDDVVYDHQFLNSNRVLISFARLSVVMKRIEMLKSCGIIPAAIDASCLALYHAFESHQWIIQKKNCAIIDIGNLSTDLLIIKKGVPFVSTDIPCTVTVTDKGTERHKVFIEFLLERLTKIFDFYKDKEEIKVKGLIITGDYTKIPGIRKRIVDRFNIPAVIGNPLKLKKINVPNLNTRQGASYAQAFGLAVRGLDSDNGINLMPHEARSLRREVLFDKKAKNIFKKNGIIASICAIILVVLLSMVINKHNKVFSDVEKLRLEKEELVYINNEEREIQSKIMKLQQLGNQRFLWSKILCNLGKAVPEGVYLKETSTAIRLVSSGQEPIEMKKFVIEGTARNHEATIKFIGNLEKYFTEITVDKIKEASQCEFKISLTL